MKALALILATVWVLPAWAPQAAAAQSGPEDVIQVSVKGDRLAFASIEDYRRAVDQPSEETRSQLARTIAALKGFTSFAQRQSSATARQGYPGQVALLIQDEYFASILNSNLVVQIGDSIIRVSPSKERVYVLPAANEKDYRDLILGNARNKKIRVFSTNEDVLDAIQAGGTGQPACREAGIGDLHSQAPAGSLTAMAGFLRYGIYFTLFAMVSPHESSGFPYQLDFTGGIDANQGYVHYRVRCGDTVSQEISTSGSRVRTKQTFQAYQGSRNLSEVYFFYRLKDPATGRFLTPNVGFRVNR